MSATTTKIYVGNVPFEHDPRELEELFAKFGRIAQYAEKRGFVFIHFEDDKDAGAAVKAMDGYEWLGRRLRVDFSTSRGDGSNRNREREGDAEPPLQMTRNLFVANIPPEVKLTELEEYFDQFGRVTSVKILPPARGNVAMSAFVDFRDVSAAKEAHDAELILAGQRLRTDYNIRKEPPRPKDDFLPTDRGFDSRDDEYDRHHSRPRDSYEHSSHRYRDERRSRSRSRDRRGSYDERATRQPEDRDQYRSRQPERYYRSPEDSAPSSRDYRRADDRDGGRASYNGERHGGRDWDRHGSTRGGERYEEYRRRDDPQQGRVYSTTHRRKEMRSRSPPPRMHELSGSRSHQRL